MSAARRLGPWLLAIAGLAAPAAAAGPAPALPLAEVAPGQRGYGLSVFGGSEPARFEVEVIGVWRNVRPGGSYILARLSGQNLEQSGVVAGMSGSPVYLDDRLAGAVAISWAFSNEAVAGITPIEAMRELYRPAAAAASRAAAASPVELAAIAGSRLDEELLVRAVARLAPAAAGGPPPVQWVAGGFAGESLALLRRAVGPVAAAGGGVGVATGPLEPGAPVAAVLVDGDLRLAVSGTVTERDGDALLAFGHSFLGTGPSLLPMAGAEIVTVISNQVNSFKIANVGEIVGAVDFDHANGIRGKLGERAPMVPLAVRMRGGGEESYRLRLADVPQLTPVLVALSLLGSLDASSDAVGAEGVDLRARFDLGDQGELEVDQSFDGPGSSLASALHLFAITGYLLQNPLAEVELEELEIEVERHVAPRTVRLTGAHVDRTVVEPGERVTVHLELTAFRGEPFRRSFELELPGSLADGRYFLLVGDGASIDGTRLALERLEPQTFAQARDLLAGLHSRREIRVLGVFPASGLAVAGTVLPRLPGSVRSLWLGRGGGGAVPLPLAAVEAAGVELDRPAEGLVRVELEVRRRSARRPGAEPGAEDESAADGELE